MERENVNIDIYEIVRIARRAGEAIMEIYGTAFDVDLKEDNSPVTQADMIAHKIIQAELSMLYPQIPCISEEKDAPSYEERKSWNLFWLVDPLDGTKEFIKKSGEFTVNIALIKGNYPVLGVVYAPAKDVMYYSNKDDGAWKQEGNGKPKRIHVREYQDKEGMIVVASLSHRSKEDEVFLQRLNIKETTSSGSSLKFCIVAEGNADIYPRMGPTMEWDTAAGQCIVEVAGGTVEDIQGVRFHYNKPSLLNGAFIAHSGCYKANPDNPSSYSV